MTVNQKCVHGWGIFLVVVIASLSCASIAVASVPFAQSVWVALLDVWLFVHGVVTLGSSFGVILWRYTDNCGKLVDGPKIFLGVLLAISVTWLVIGNVAVGIVYGNCNANNFGTIFYLQPIDCSTFVLPFTLAIVVIFDVIYIILGVILSLNFGNCCRKEIKTKGSFKPKWMLWLLVGLAVGYLMLGVLCIGVGASFLEPCHLQDWVPIWLITQGVIIVVIVVLATCWIRFKIRLRDSWVQPTIMLIVPIIFFIVLAIIAAAIGNVWLAQERIQTSAGIAPCNQNLQVLSSIIVALLDIPALLLVYMAGVLFLLIIILLMVTSITYLTQDDNAVVPVSCGDSLAGNGTISW